MWLTGHYLPNQTRHVALTITGLTLLLSCLLLIGFDSSSAEAQFVEYISWIPAFHIHYYLGIDGISLPMILLTTFSTLLAVWSIPVRVYAGGIHSFFSAFLLLEGLLIGVFAAMDAMLFYVFWEAILIPMYLIIGVWGGPQRLKASFKFFLYTFLGSVFMLLALLYLYIETGSFYITDFYSLALPETVQLFSVHRFLPGICRQDPHVACTYLVTGRSRGSTDSGFGHSGRCVIKTGRLRLFAFLPADRP